MRIAISLATALRLFCSPATAQAQGDVDAAQWIREAENVLANVDSYTALFHKQERIQGRLLAEETILLKFQKPFRVYMKWTEAPNKGRETLYVAGWNGNRIKAHEGGLLGIVNANLDPRGSLAMRGNRHPITDVGLEKLVEKIGAQLRKGLARGEFERRDMGEEWVYGRRTRKLESVSPKDASKGYYCHRTVTNVDVELKVPIRIRIYDWDDQLVESYGFENLRLGAGLTDADFDPDNKEYRF